MVFEISSLFGLSVLTPPNYGEEPPLPALEFLSDAVQPPQWQRNCLWQSEQAAAEFLQTGAIDQRTSRRLELYIYRKAREFQSNPKKIKPDSLMDLAVLAEALADHSNARTVYHITFKLAQTIEIYLATVKFKMDPLHRQLIEENIAFVKEAASAAFAMGEFNRTFQLSLALFHQSRQFLEWGEKDEDSIIKREALEARLWVKLFVAKIAEHPKAEEQDIKMDADAFLTSFAVDVGAMTDRLRRLAYEKEKNALPSTDRLMAEALLKLAEEELSKKDSLEAFKTFRNLSRFYKFCPHSFSFCDIAMSRLKAAEALIRIYGQSDPNVANVLIEATEVLRTFNPKTKPWQIDCLCYAWLDLKLTVLARPQGLDLDSKEIRDLLSNLATQIKLSTTLLEKLEGLVAEPNAQSQFRRYSKLCAQIVRLRHWIEQGKTLLAEITTGALPRT